jgi:hypothetical protein
VLSDDELTFNNLTITFSREHYGIGSGVQPLKRDIKKFVSNFVSL